MKQGLSLRVSQHLALTPQLQQSIRLLQLSTLELSQEVGQMLDENPFLEVSTDDLPREEFGLPQADAPVRADDLAAEFVPNSGLESGASIASGNASEGEAEAMPLSADDGQNWDGDGSLPMSPDDSEWGGDARAHGNNLSDSEDTEVTDLAHAQESLQNHLQTQALALRLSQEDRAALSFLIDSLNDDGYLEDALATLARGLGPADEEQYEQLLQHFTVALRLLQSMEPSGVGARDLAECLNLQLKAMLVQCQNEDKRKAATLKVALHICAQPMELLARRDIKRLTPLCKATDVEVREAIALIAHLDPKPGRRFANLERNIVVPDVLVVKVGKGAQARFQARLNPDVMPRLRVHDIYANALRQHKGGGSDAGNYAALQQRLQEARGFIKNIQQRFDTILRVSSAIVERQKSFFTHGELAMRPLVLREIADELGLHESTISRVTTAKYMATPFGTFELKYFFGSGLGTDSGGNASSTAVRALLKQFIGAEDLKRPLSDNQLSEMLKEQGIECARRTVAKYREGLRIAPASLRKAL